MRVYGVGKWQLFDVRGDGVAIANAHAACVLQSMVRVATPFAPLHLRIDRGAAIPSGIYRRKDPAIFGRATAGLLFRQAADSNQTETAGGRMIGRILIVLFALAFGGCRADHTSLPISDAEARHLVELCGGDPSSPRVPARDGCVEEQARKLVMRNMCIDSGVTPNLVDRCTAMSLRYFEASRRCGDIALSRGSKDIVACARAKEPEGYNWFINHHA